MPDGCVPGIGLPEVLRTDNGQPFAGTGIAGLSRLAVWLIKLGIRPERIRKGHPEENGRHERMHRFLKSAVKQGNTFMTMEEQQRWFSDYRKEFNYERPHEALAGATPGTVWQPQTDTGMAVFLNMLIRKEVQSTG
jgi:transposase InsO family protein